MKSIIAVEVSGWELCVLISLTGGSFAGCSEQRESIQRERTKTFWHWSQLEGGLQETVQPETRQFFKHDREKRVLLALLGNMLGEGFEVANFGCSGTTLLKNGNSPYWNTKEYTNAKAFLPNIVIVKLGSNDSKSGNWSSHGSEFESDLTDLVLFLTESTNSPEVFVYARQPRRWQLVQNERRHHNELKLFRLFSGLPQLRISRS